MFSFTDRTTTTKENEENPTVKALAELYAHVHNLPESAEKRRMFIKRVSNHNSVITPNRSLTDSIKVYLNIFFIALLLVSDNFYFYLILCFRNIFSKKDQSLNRVQ